MKDMSNAPAGAIADAPDGTPRLDSERLVAVMRESADYIYGTGRTGWANGIRRWADHVDRMAARIRELEAAAAAVISAAEKNLDRPVPARWLAPWEALNNLRAALPPTQPTKEKDNG